MTSKLTTPLGTPITDFTLACDRLLTNPIARDTLTKDELSTIKMCIQRLTERFFGQRSLGEPDVGPPITLPHGTGGPVE